jgi:hypothetical protein
VQPAALGRVERPAIGGAARDDPERQAAAFAAKIPQRRVDRCERERRNRAYGCRVGGEFELAPDRFDPFRFLADQPRSEMVGEEAHDGRAAGADRIAVACPDRAVAVSDRDDRRLLRHEALNRVGALDLGGNVNEPQLNPLDPRHC